MINYETAASELLRALRGPRSQLAFSRKLGFRGNPITDWENGRRYPTASHALQAAEVVQVRVEAAFQRFARVPTPRSDRGFVVHEWLDALRGSTSIADLSKRSGRSRHAIARWLTGKAQPRLPDFLRLVDAISGRVHDWVNELVGIRHVPSLQETFERVEAARQLALQTPWSEAVLRLLETTEYQSSNESAQAYIARRLGLDDDAVQTLLHELLRAKIIEQRGTRYAVIDNLTVDTGTNIDLLHDLRSHWARVGLQRLEAHAPCDWFAYNLITVSEEDARRIELRLRAAYREVRAIVAESSPGEVAALLTLHLVRW